MNKLAQFSTNWILEFGLGIDGLKFWIIKESDSSKREDIKINKWWIFMKIIQSCQLCLLRIQSFYSELNLNKIQPYSTQRDLFPRLLNKNQVLIKSIRIIRKFYQILQNACDFKIDIICRLYIVHKSTANFHNLKLNCFLNITRTNFLKNCQLPFPYNVI